MKPWKLTMSAFGSYADETTIDFSKQEQGIFLVTGDTGAGKTTIFDAMMYALYNQTSGGERDGNMMRSQYAKDTVETYVIFQFSYAGKMYTIRRNPEYVVKRQLKNGTLKDRKVAGAVELTMPDGTVFPEKKSGTDAKISEIVGLDAAQFTQTVMIAQGEFLKLLYTRSEDRKKIFGKLFHTESYWRIQESLKRKKGEMEDLLLENERAFAQEQGRIIYPEDLSEEERAVISLEELVNRDRAKEKELNEQKAKKQEALDAVRRIITQAETENRLFDRLDEALERQVQLKEKEPEEETRKQRIAAAKRAAKVLVAEEKLSEKQRQKKASETEIKRLSEWLLQERIEYQKMENLLKEEEEAFQKKQKEEERTLHRLEESLPEYEKLTAARRKEQEAKVHYRQAKEQFARMLAWKFAQIKKNEETCKNLEAEVKGCEENQMACHKETVEAQNEYDRMYEALIRTQAGRMAESLTDGMPCPVCGSLSHPKPARLPEGAVSEADVKKAKEKRNAAEEKRDRATGLLNQKREAYQEKCHVLKQQKADFAREADCAADVYAPEAALPEVEPEPIEKLTVKERARDVEICQKEAENIRNGLTFDTETEARKQIEKIRSMLTEETRAIEEKRQKLSATEKKITQAEGQRKQEENLQEQLETEEQHAEEAFALALSEADFSDRTEYEQAKIKEQELDELERQSVNYQKEMDDNRTVIQKYKEDTKDKQRVDISAQREQEQQIFSDIEAVQQQASVLYNARVTNEAVLKQNESYLQKRAALREQNAVIKSLSDTANGRLSQSAKMDFETYVQRHYFEQIITEANKRLLIMSHEQFLLKLKETGNTGKRSNEGLDLAVYSLITDSERDIKTLSGGESFLAALAMALGLADIVARNAGAIRMDMMFIDEGFGSLDMQARTQAIKVLHELAGNHRMIGIISHVTELKEQIDRKLIVTRTERGSKVAWSEEN